MDGGFVTRNCPECGQKTTLPEHAFFNDLDIWVACPECKQRMKPAWVDNNRNNYGYHCETDDLGIRLADLLPSWEDLIA